MTTVLIICRISLVLLLVGTAGLVAAPQIPTSRATTVAAVTCTGMCAAGAVLFALTVALG